MTYRERREARAARLEGWAERREERARGALEALDALPYAHDWAFVTQPGRIPERERMNRREARAVADLGKADDMARRAEEIRRQAAHAVYDDDPDAAERLRERLASLEAERARKASANAEYRRAHPELRAMGAYERSTAVPFAPYELSNLGGSISRTRARLARVERGPSRTRFHGMRSDPGVCWTCDRTRDEHDEAGWCPREEDGNG